MAEETQLQLSLDDFVAQAFQSLAMSNNYCDSANRTKVF